MTKSFPVMFPRNLRSLPLVIGILAVFAYPGAANSELPATGISYTIDVRLDPETRELQGRETIEWTHPGSEALTSVPLHLYLNAFAHEQTTWMHGVPARRLDRDKFIERWPDPWGWNEPTSIRQGDAALAWRPIAPDDGNHLDRSLIEVTLAEPLEPGATLTLDIEFSARLPIIIARTGGAGNFFMVGQWFPKIGVLETTGTRGATADRWAAHQFHGATEFYADYADYDIQIAVPNGWSVVATGRGESLPRTADGIVRHRFRQRAVHDFAFATGNSMVTFTSTYQPKGPGGPVDLTVFLPQGTEHHEPVWRRAAEACLDVLGSRIGAYPYDVMTVVQPPGTALRSLGMEYPTLYTGGVADPLIDRDLFAGLKMSETTIAHECAHQYFYGLIGSNEIEEAFLDEGFTEHWGNEIVISEYGDPSGSGEFLGRAINVTGIEKLGLPEPDETPPPILSGPSYLMRGHSLGAQFYRRPAATVRTAMALFGSDTVDRFFAEYFRTWKFRHPGFEDMLESVRVGGGEEMAAFFEEAYTHTHQPDYRVARLSTETWSPPRGRLQEADGTFRMVTELDDEQATLRLAAAALEDDGSVAMEVTDPGWTRGTRRHPGSMARRAVVAESGEVDEDWEEATDEKVEEYHISTVRLEGPSWDHLPVDVLFRFADGAVIREAWDGRAPYRIYRFLRQAPLSEARVDPEGKIALDPDPINNSQLREPNERLVNDWAYWFSAISNFLGEALASWL